MDITDDAALESAYREQIPVVFVAGRKAFKYRVEPRNWRGESPQRHKPRLTAVCDKRTPAAKPLATLIGNVTSDRHQGGFVGSDRLTVGVAARLSRYLQVLTQAKKMGRDSISSQEIGEYTNVNATQIRRDLSGFGKFGKRGVGYNIDSLISEIRKILRTAGQHNIALIGAGDLGRAIASSTVFADHGFHIAGVFDSDPAKTGTQIAALKVQDANTLAETVREKNIIVGVLAVPPAGAQSAADALVAAGVKIIFSYSDALIDTPPDVTVPSFEPRAALLYALYFHLT